MSIKKNWIQMNWKELLKYIIPALIGVIITTATFILKEQRENKIASVQQSEQIKNLESDCKDFKINKLDVSRFEMYVEDETYKYDILQKKIDKIDTHLDKLEFLLLNKVKLAGSNVDNSIPIVKDINNKLDSTIIVLKEFKKEKEQN